LEINTSKFKLQKSISNSLIAKTIVKPDLVVLSGIKEIDKLLGGFKSGEITFIDGDSSLISNIPNQLCVNTYKTFYSDTIYIDGGVCADPYKIAKYARLMELDQKETLRRVHISRAFTVYQLSTLISEMLEPAIKRYKPRTLIIGRLPVLYLDPDVKTKEARVILKNNLEKLRELTRKYDLITIFTNLDRRLSSNQRGIRDTVCSNVNEIISMNQTERCINVSLLNKKQETVILTFAKGQTRLQDFGMVI